MEHHLRGNENRLREVDNEHQREVTTATDVSSATRVAKGGLSMTDVIYVTVFEISLQMKMSCYSSRELGKDPGGGGLSQRGGLSQ